MYARPFFKYFTVHALQGKEKKMYLQKQAQSFVDPTCFSMEKCAL